MNTLVGTTLSRRYRLERKLGSGGSSTVCLATDEKLERQVAIKVMNQEVTTDSEQLERFRREARAVARLSHVNVVGVIDTGEDDGHPYIVFEYVQGETLKERIRREGQLPIPEAVAYAIEIARALQAAHEHHIVHRDVKPQNVLIDAESGAAKVTDFGIARTLEEDGLTSDGRVIGTTDYVAPEQAMGRGATAQSDIYSLGIVLYEMLTGQLPFKGEGQVAVAMKHVRERMPDVRANRPEVSATLATIVDRATAKDPSHRYGSDQQLIGELEDVLALEATRAGAISEPVNTVFESLPTETRRRVPMTVRRRRLTLVILGVLVVAAAAAAAVLLLHAKQGPGRTRIRHGLRPGTELKLIGTSAYNPFGYGGDTAQNNAQAKYAIDGNPRTAWPTQTYASGQLAAKDGVGLYVWTARKEPLERLELLTATPGFDVTIYGTNTQPSGAAASVTTHPTPRSLGWHFLGNANDVTGDKTIPLNTGFANYKYVLVWITTLPVKGYADINEVRLYAR